MTQLKPADLQHLTPEQLRAMVLQLQANNDQLVSANNELASANTTLSTHNDKLTHELALLRRHRFGKRSEGMDKHQLALLDALVDEDIAAIEAELEALSPKAAEQRVRKRAKRQPLPKDLPRTEIHHEPENTNCSCGCALTRIGEDVSEKLDYQPGIFSVERHIRGKWCCRDCDSLVQAPVAPHIIDKGIPTTNLLAQVLISKYADHLPLHRQAQQFARAGVSIPRSTLADWVGRCGVELQPLIDALRETLLKEAVLHADETPVAMLAPGKKQTHKAYVWAYASTRYSAIQGVVYDFQPGRAGQAARDFLAEWQGKLVCDDYAGYKAGFANGISEVGCWAHARRKFHDLHVANKSQIAGQALNYTQDLYRIERELAELTPQARQVQRQERSKPITDQLHHWLIAKRQQVPDGSGTAKAINYSVKRWEALTRYLDDGAIPIDNNWVENQIRPWALGRSNWLFAGSLRSGQRAANIMTLVQSAKINDLNPQAYLKDIMERLPTQKASRIGELLPHNWKP
ncbi:IS66 family transposase [Spongiibacter tropicus]|uniref:IS66 family transposase n=1 Tax=Spongiibacter tropicus TaxID=454602 RepID=UPI0035BE3185